MNVSKAVGGYLLVRYQVVSDRLTVRIRRYLTIKSGRMLTVMNHASTRSDIYEFYSPTSGQFAPGQTCVALRKIMCVPCFTRLCTCWTNLYHGTQHDQIPWPSCLNNRFKIQKPCICCQKMPFIATFNMTHHISNSVFVFQLSYWVSWSYITTGN